MRSLLGVGAGTEMWFRVAGESSNACKGRSVPYRVYKESQGLSHMTSHSNPKLSLLESITHDHSYSLIAICMKKH